jgi:hypothetical protein
MRRTAIYMFEMCFNIILPSSTLSLNWSVSLEFSGSKSQRKILGIWVSRTGWALEVASLYRHLRYDPKSAEILRHVVPAKRMDTSAPARKRSVKFNRRERKIDIVGRLDKRKQSGTNFRDFCWNQRCHSLRWSLLLSPDNTEVTGFNCFCLVALRLVTITWTSSNWRRLCWTDKERKG